MAVEQMAVWSYRAQRLRAAAPVQRVFWRSNVLRWRGRVPGCRASTRLPSASRWPSACRGMRGSVFPR